MPALTADLAAALQKRANVRTPAHAAQYVTCFLLGLLGALAGGYTGWLCDTGLDVIAGATIGFLLLSGVSFCVTGLFERHAGSSGLDVVRAAMSADPGRIAVVGHSSFDLYVTVHRVKNLYISGPFMGLLGRVYNTYVEVTIGKVEHDGSLTAMKNPEKKTCVSTSGIFEECFHFIVSPTEDTIRFVIYSQELFTDEVIGICDVPITAQVLQESFPQQRTFNVSRVHPLLTLAEQDAVNDRDARQLAGTIVASFTPGASYQEPDESTLQHRSRLAYRHRQEVQEQLLAQTSQYTTYGTWATTLMP